MSPLSGITVIEAGSFITIPYAGLMLADLGAEVIKVERPDGGDPIRGYDGARQSAYFRSANRNKKSVVIDLRLPEGQQVFRRLVERADLLTENNRPGVMDKLGLGYDALSKLNPRLVYCSVTGFGPTGPYRDRPSFDAVGQAIGGMLSLYVDPEDPRVAGAPLSDHITGLHACYASLAGLMQRERTGKGCRVETNMMHATMSFLEFWFVDYYVNRVIPGVYRKAQLSMQFALRASDGKMLAIHFGSLQPMWKALAAALEFPQLANDPRFDTFANRAKNYEALRAELGAIVCRRPRSHWIDVLEKRDVPCAPIYSVDEAPADPQVRHLGLFHELRHPKADLTTLALKRPVWIDGETGSEHAIAAPVLGEHTGEVLSALGYTKSEIDGLRQRKIVEMDEA